MSNRIQFWKRELGSLWAPFEREKIIEFSKIKSNEPTTISGYVKWISNRVFALVPTLFSNQTYLLCLNQTQSRPIENSYITVSGSTRFFDLRITHQDSRVFDGKLLLDVYSWKVSKPDFKIPKEETSFRDFKIDLTSRIEGLEPKIRDFLAFTVISTPGIYGSAGGLNSTVYDSTDSNIPKKVIKEVQLAVPRGIGNLCTISTELGRFGMRYQYNYVVARALIVTQPQRNNFN